MLKKEHLTFLASYITLKRPSPRMPHQMLAQMTPLHTNNCI